LSYFLPCIRLLESAHLRRYPAASPPRRRACTP
jgi:hypothetical protein